MLIKLAYLIHHKLGDEYGGSPSPPGSGQRLEFGEKDNGKHVHYATTYNNDGFELWLGNDLGWNVFYRAEYARQLAWFILWTWWAKGTWFGLKRRIWYWSLGIIVESYKERRKT